MKKRLTAAFLLLAVLLLCLSGVSASGVLCFVAVNDSIPLFLSKEASPFYYNNELYIPYTAYDSNPAGVIVSNNADSQTLALFTKSQRLIYDLEQETVKDEKGDVESRELVFSEGIVFLPASDAAHFGLTVSLLYSETGCPIIRFTNGAHIYDDAMFANKAENFIRHTLDENRQAVEEDPDRDPNTPDSNTPGAQDPNTEPATVYLAFTGNAVAQKTLEFLTLKGLKATFFVTEEQLNSKPELIQAIYSAGHIVGVTAPVSSTDWNTDLALANDAMDRTLFCKSLFALVPPEQQNTVTGYALVLEPLVTPTIQDALLTAGEPQILVCRTDMTALIETLLETGVSLPQLRETTKLSAPAPTAE